MFTIFKKMYNKFQRDFIVIKEGEELSILYFKIDVRLYNISDKSLRPIQAVAKNGWFTDKLVVADLETKLHFQKIFSRWYKGVEYFGGASNLVGIEDSSRDYLKRIYETEIKPEDKVIIFKK